MTYTLVRGTSPLLISIPHAGTILPPAIAAQLQDPDRALTDTDWHVDTLYEFAAEAGATVLAATHSRTVIDLNRNPAGGLLYPGQAETTVCPTETFAGVPLYTTPPDAEEIARRLALYWHPYHATLTAELARLRALHGRAILLDAHSIRGVIPRLFAGRLPDLNFGTNGGASAAPAIAACAMAAIAKAGFAAVLDGRFRGGHITRHYGEPTSGIHAIQLELAQRTYMDEDRPTAFDPSRARRLVNGLRELVRELQAIGLTQI